MSDQKPDEFAAVREAFAKAPPRCGVDPNCGCPMCKFYNAAKAAMPALLDAVAAIGRWKEEEAIWKDREAELLGEAKALREALFAVLSDTDGGTIPMSLSMHQRLVAILAGGKP